MNPNSTDSRQKIDRYKILVVDDTLANRRILQATFPIERFEVVTAGSAQEALTALRQLNHGIDLVLSDIMMPGETGFDLLNHMKSSGPPLSDLPVLFITSELPEPENRVLGLSMGAVDYVLRSLDSQELVVRVTNAIQSYNQMRDLQGHLESAESLASKGRLLAASHHEIKNLAAIIKATSSIIARLLQQQVVSAPDATLTRAVEGLAKSSDLLADICRNSSQILSPTSDQIQPRCIAEILQQVELICAPVLKGRRASLTIETQTENLWARVRASQLKQVLINLIMNGIDASEEMRPDGGGAISLKATEEGSGQGLKISVTDNGVGFEKAEVRTEFAPFSTTKQLRGGTGLGLWLCSQFLKGMDGALSLSSQGPGKGATACVVVQRCAPFNENN